MSFPSVVFQHFSKTEEQGWLTGPSPMLYDTAPLFVYTNQLLRHCIFICSNVH